MLVFWKTFVYVLNESSHIIKSAFRILSNISDGAFWVNSRRIIAVYYFCKQTWSKIFDRVLNKNKKNSLIILQSQQ